MLCPAGLSVLNHAAKLSDPENRLTPLENHGFQK